MKKYTRVTLGENGTTFENRKRSEVIGKICSDQRSAMSSSNLPVGFPFVETQEVVEAIYLIKETSAGKRLLGMPLFGM